MYLSRNRQLGSYDETPEEHFSAHLRTLTLRAQQTDFETARRAAYDENQGLRNAYTDIWNVCSLTQLYIRLRPLQHCLIQTKLWKQWAVQNFIGHSIEVRGKHVTRTVEF
jgi:hypothetical protein